MKLATLYAQPPRPQAPAPTRVDRFFMEASRGVDLQGALEAYSRCGSRF
jgi:hypothetical protein